MNKAVKRAQAAYNSLTLPFYDAWVHGISNPLAWGCATGELQGWYERHITDNHLEVGVGTGFFLDRVTFGHRCPRIVLMDLNPRALTYTARRIARFHPDTHLANVLQPIDYDGPPFASAGMGYLFHCLPGTLEERAASFRNVAALLKPDGVLFGATILPEGRPNLFARALLEGYNRLGIFNNRGDYRAAIQVALERSFREVDVRRRGQVVMFAASHRR
jgi:SAM-dependent methyltransferase